MADTVPDPDRPCLHPRFESLVGIQRIVDEGGEDQMPHAFVAEIRIRCECGEPFRFSGLPAGLSYQQPRVSVDETELRAPIRPAGADADFGLGLPSVGIRIVE